MRWTKEDEEDLKLGCELGLTYKEIGDIIGCSSHAISNKAISLKISNKLFKLKTNEQYDKELKEKCPTIIRLEDYKGNRIKILHKCTICNTEYKCTPNHKIEGSICKYCANNVLKTHEQYVEDLARKRPNIKVIEKYITAKTAILHKCTLCNTEYNAIPNNYLQRKTSINGCKNCMLKTYSISINKPATIYLVYFDKLNLYKIGVTGRTTKIRNNEQNLNYEIIFELYFNTGMEALLKEQEWLKNIKHLQLNTGLLKNGNTETFRY